LKILDHIQFKIDIVKKLLREIIAFLLIEFHNIFKRGQKGILSIYFHNPSKALFEKILKWLITKGYKIISIKELELFIKQKQSSDKLAFISFDDGWRGNLELMDSIDKYKVPVTIFISTNAVMEGNFWWEYVMIKGQQKFSGIKNLADFKRLPESIFYEKIEVLKNNYFLERSCITLDELIKICDHEMITIGSHTITHPILIRCSLETQTNELKESKRTLINWLNKDVEYMSYPNGDYDGNTIEIAKRCGYKLALTTNPGVIDIEKVNPYEIPRNALYDDGGFFENLSKMLGIWQKLIPVK